MATKNDVEIEKARSRAHIVGEVVGLVKTLFTIGCILGCVWIVVDGLKSMVLANPASISALADVVKNLKLDSIIGWLVGLAGVTYGALERRGKKRLLRKHADNRRVLEANDRHNESSGLTDSGDTP